MSGSPTPLRWLRRPALAAVVLTACALLGAFVLGANGDLRPDAGDALESRADGPDVPAALEPDAHGFVFPLDGSCTLTDSFGDPRSGGRSHTGVDILADKMVPVRALAGGQVRWVMDEREGRCCSLEIEHEDGWRSRYIHLNNDSPGTDDGLVVGVAPGLERGTPVRAGDVVGWVGDSGNAESTASHLHFELLPPGGGAIDPLPLLRMLDDSC